jgi:hypothetical protein
MFKYTFVTYKKVIMSYLKKEAAIRLEMSNVRKSDSSWKEFVAEQAYNQLKTDLLDFEGAEVIDPADFEEIVIVDSNNLETEEMDSVGHLVEDEEDKPAQV